MFESVRSRVLALLAVLGLGAGLVVTVTERGCSVTSVTSVESVVTSPVAEGEGEGETLPEQPSDADSVSSSEDTE